MSTSFASILDESPEEVVRPKPLPAGTYLCRVQGPPKYDKSTKKGTDYVEFTLVPLAAEDDVDPDALAEAGGVEGKTLRTTFYLTEEAVYRLDEFHEHCGIDLTDGASRRSRNDEVINAEVLAVVKHRQPEGSDRVYAEISRTASSV